MYEDDVTIICSGNIYATMSFQIKKNPCHPSNSIPSIFYGNELIHNHLIAI